MEVYMLLTYENLRIRNATLEDAQMLCQWWNDGKVMAHAGFPNGLHTNTEKIIRELSTDSDDTYRRLIIEVSNIPVGEMSYRNKGNNIAEIGIKICDFSKQEKGHGTLFLKMLISGLFANGYEKIILDTNVNNARAQHVYEKLGFKKLRINHNSWKNQLGEPQSSIDYEMLKSQFIPLNI
jgi:Acetyltransferases, including N-acetylases of ribosomal proteins